MTDGPGAPPRVLVAIPVFGSPELTDTMLADLLRDPVPAGTRIVVVDNGNDYELPDWAAAVTMHRPGSNLRWIGTANWAMAVALAEGLDVCVVLNNDTRFSRNFLAGLTEPFINPSDIAVVAACYDDFWIHQRASDIPATAADYQPGAVLRDVPFCDGTAIAFSVKAIVELGTLDQKAFPRHGYGSDIDFALRVRAAGWRCVVTEAAYVAHLRRATMTRTGQSAELNRAEILTGLDAKWGGNWRGVAGLGPGAFPPHNTSSAHSWYLPGR
jgi:GT2 family glycosyltransferase